MSRIFLFGIVALMAWACSPVKNASKTSAVIAKSIQDSTEYEILIVDNGFDQWYLLNFTPAQDRTNEYYHTKNIISVGNWNDLYHTLKYSNIIDSYIDYRPDVEYGIGVNRKLYWYFRYVRSKYGIRLF
jgi:hypothetical protein